ncbi:hypothetical protein TNCV_4428031 [Trichonephila clavipes]|nr:hypothetical protein TNCV_4428031 [Trichonephila clavipes]
MAFGSYTNAGKSVSSPKGTTLKVDVFRCCELFRFSDWRPYPPHHLTMVQNDEVRRQSPRVAEQCDVNIRSLTD